MISHLSMKNFTAFTGLSIDFSPGIVLLGLDAFDRMTQKAVMTGFKDKLQADAGEESFEASKRKHIADCVVLSVESWNQVFPNWPLRREPLMELIQ